MRRSTGDTSAPSSAHQRRPVVGEQKVLALRKKNGKNRAGLFRQRHDLDAWLEQAAAASGLFEGAKKPMAPGKGAYRAGVRACSARNKAMGVARRQTTARLYFASSVRRRRLCGRHIPGFRHLIPGEAAFQEIDHPSIGRATPCAGARILLTDIWGRAT